MYSSERSSYNVTVIHFSLLYCSSSLYIVFLLMLFSFHCYLCIQENDNIYSYIEKIEVYRHTGKNYWSNFKSFYGK